MIGYVTLGTNDLEKASVFYDAISAKLGLKRCFDGGNFRTWGKEGMGELSITKPFNGAAATAGNGTMVALQAAEKEMVKAVYEEALAQGGVDEGAPGYRGEEGGFYAAYFRDLDGNKLNIFTFG